VVLAVSYNVNIIEALCPEYDGKKLRNVSYLLSKDGNFRINHTKLHTHSYEASFGVWQEGNGINVFEELNRRQNRYFGLL